MQGVSFGIKLQLQQVELVPIVVFARDHSLLQSGIACYNI